MATASEYLDTARRMRQAGDVDACRDAAQSAYVIAAADGDGETVYHARACVGRLHGYRAEYSEAYEFFRAAFREVEVYRLDHWIPAAHHDCFAYALVSRHGPLVAGEHALHRWEAQQKAPETMDAFLHNLAFVQGVIGHRQPDGDFLYLTASTATWLTAKSPFDRMLLAGSQAIAAGLAQRPAWFHLSERRFSEAVDAMGHMEGYALTALELARGALTLGLKTEALFWLARAERVASIRSENRVLEIAAQIRAAANAHPQARTLQCAAS